MSSGSTESTTLVTRPLPHVAPNSSGQRAEPRIALLIYHREGVEVVPLHPGAPVVIGRASPSQVRVRDDSLSRKHARLTLQGDVVLVEDLRSTNGTWVGDAQIARAEVRPGDELVLGHVMVSVRVIAPEEGVLPGLAGYERFRSTLEEEVVRARLFGRALVLVMARAARGKCAHVGNWWPRVRGLLRPVDRVGLYSLDAVAILLPEASADVGLELARAITGARVPGEPTLLAGVAAFPEAAVGTEQLLAVCWSATQVATPERPVRRAPSGAQALRAEAGRSGEEEGAVVVSPAMRGIMAAVERLARSSIPVLLQGETGSGKEVLARMIHERSPRSTGPMVSVNCGAIPQQLVESTLFGHERGAFTGASQQHKGVFEAADGGTVLLDEIGELPLAAQAALLRVLETKRVTRVGSSREITVDVRLIAATHRDLEAMCASGTFRVDLLYRLNAMTLTIPPLRERVEEIEPLSLRFLDLSNRANGRDIRGIDPLATALLARYPWPGNVRELRNAIERAVVIAEGDWITEADLPERVRAAAHLAGPAPLDSPEDPAPSSPEGGGDEPDHEAVETAAGSAGDNLKARVRRYETELIIEALREAGWNQTEAARRLGTPLRTLIYRLKVLGIKRLGYTPGGEPPS